MIILWYDQWLQRMKKCCLISWMFSFRQQQKKKLVKPPCCHNRQDFDAKDAFFNKAKKAAWLKCLNDERKNFFSHSKVFFPLIRIEDFPLPWENFLIKKLFFPYRLVSNSFHNFDAFTECFFTFRNQYFISRCVMCLFCLQQQLSVFGWMLGKWKFSGKYNVINET